MDQAQAQLQIARLEASQTRESVSNEIAASLAELERATSAYEASRESVKEAEEAFNLASLRFSRGMSTQLEVSDAQLALTTARTNSARATYDLYLAAVALAQAQGKPIPLPDGTTIEPNAKNR